MHRSGVIENKAFIFALCFTQTPTETLNPANFRFRRTGVNDAPDITVKPGNQCADVHDDFCSALLKAVDDKLALFMRGICGNNLCIHTRPVKRYRDKICMADGHTKTDGRQVLTVGQPVIDHVTDQIRTRHDCRYLSLFVIAAVLCTAGGFNRRKIRLCWGVKLIRTQVPALDQFFHRGGFDQSFVIRPQERRKRCAGQANHLKFIIADNFQQFFTAQMSLIDKQQIDVVREFTADQRIG